MRQPPIQGPDSVCSLPGQPVPLTGSETNIKDPSQRELKIHSTSPKIRARLVRTTATSLTSRTPDFGATRFENQLDKRYAPTTM